MMHETISHLSFTPQSLDNILNLSLLLALAKKRKVHVFVTVRSFLNVNNLNI